MEFVGVDIGNFKTVVASSRENGKIYEDEQGKRAVKTVMELSVPVRKFGNSVTSDVEQMLALRHRAFRDSLDGSKNWENMAMFMRYLSGIVKKNTPTHPTVCMTIPMYFKEKERRVLSDLGHAMGLKLERIMTDVTAIGVFACLRREKIPSEFMIFDFGFSKSTAGLFSFENNVFRPVYGNVVKVGAMQFDEKLIDIVINKHSLDNTSLMREKVRRSLDKIKTTLNSTEQCSLQLFLTDSPLNVVVSQEEYRSAVQRELEELRSFVDAVMAETKFEGLVEVIGGNSSSFLIKDLLKDRVNYQVTLNISESSAIGAALGMACGSMRTKYVIHDFVGRDIFVKIQGEDVKPTAIFRSMDAAEGNPKAITYNRKSGFGLEIIEDGEVVAVLSVKKTETDDPEPVHISLCIGRLGTVDVMGVECKSIVEYEYKHFRVEELEIENIKALEARYRKEEDGVERIGSMRNELETMAVGLGDALYSRFGDVVTEDEMNRVKEIAMDLFDIPSSETLCQEEKVKESVLEKLAFVSDRLEEQRKKVVEELEMYRGTINMFKTENPKMFTPSFYKLQGLLYKIDDHLKTFDLSIFNAGQFDGGFLGGVREDVQKHLKKAEQEVEEKRQAEAKKAEQETRKSEKEESDDASSNASIDE